MLNQLALEGQFGINSMSVGVGCFFRVAADNVVRFLLSLVYKILVFAWHRSHQSASVVGHIALLGLWL